MNCIYCGVDLNPNVYCWNCGNKLPNCLEDELVGKHFKDGYSYKEILQILASHQIQISMRTLKRRIKRLGLSRRKTDFDRNALRAAISLECQGPCSLMGYRGLWHQLRCFRGMFEGVFHFSARDTEIEVRDARRSHGW